MFELSDVRVGYDGRRVLDIDRLTLAGDAVTVILGHNGSGKSTLMSLLARQRRPDGGTVALHGRPLGAYSQRALARAVAFLPQRLPDVPGLDVRELCGLGRFPWRGALGRWRAADDAAVAAALARTHMTAFAGRIVDHLSGGERQRAWIAMLLAQEAPILMLDEPISALDLAHQVEVLSLLRDLNRASGCGVITILHDINLAAHYADRIVALKGGRIAFDGSPEELMQEPVLSGLYGLDIALVDHPTRTARVAVIA
ncbi:ABC transporter ATP-binding protein [Caenispirillum bisanense]|uniref:ABC transporter ATP-binding protein n=1 Tax=Caenispirillum bisanense TaxID=414052 RepID=UPI0031D8324D